MSETTADHIDSLGCVCDRILADLEAHLARLREAIKQLEQVAAELGYVEPPCSC